MESKKQASIMRAAITAAIVVAAILIVGSFWNGKSAGADTEKAVRSVSLLYLNELAERREQVVAARLADYISDMDIQMPVMDGYTATKNIRLLENKALAQIPIVAMTANAFAEDVKAAEDAGMQAHIAKPVDVKLMIKTLARVLDGRKA